MSAHGTRTRYVKGCRCTDCRTANTEYQADLRERLAARDRAQVPHGTKNGYSAWGCRCERCTAANADDGRAYRRNAAARDAAS